MLWFFICLFLPETAVSRQYCGGVFTGKRGVLQTPNFPHKFQTPINCEWIIKAENRRSQNTSIIVYFTQVYLYEGITLTEYVEYDKRYPIDGHVIAVGDVLPKVNYIQTHRNVLVITLKLDTVDSNHLRVMDYFLDVYGFNITYEITNGEVRKDYCNMMDCGFTGICYDYVTKFGCKCFDGYTGPKCSEGPNSGCFNQDGSPVCHNGASCAHVGNSYAECTCPRGFTGEICDIPKARDERKGTAVSCVYDGSPENVCKCSDEDGRLVSDLQVYTVTVMLKDLPPFPSGTQLPPYISNQILNSLRTNGTEVRSLHVTSLEKSPQSEFEVTFRLHGSRTQENQLKAVINSWGQVGSVGNLSVANPDVDVYKEPILSIQSVKISPEGKASPEGIIPPEIHENDEFILSCLAQGSPNMSFRWYKDGIFINATRSKNNKWMTLRPGPTLKTYVAILTVDRATIWDQGVFTCQVEDYNIQQCLSKGVHIISRPFVTLDVMSKTVAKGESFSIKCLSHNHGNETVYSWTKNGKLLPIKTKRERYLTLYPTGSLLQVSGLSKSANYSCLAQSRSIQSEISVFVTVIDKKLVKMCEAETRYNVRWPETAPGSESIQACPSFYKGLAKRSCRMLDANLPKWETPDMSLCESDVLQPVIAEFELLRQGYEATSPPRTLNGTLMYIKSGIRLLDGEGARILKLIEDVISYINDSEQTAAVDEDAYGFAESIIGEVMTHNHSLVNEQQVVQLQQVMKNVLFSATQLSTFKGNSSTVDSKIQPVDKMSRFLSYYMLSSARVELKLPHAKSDSGSVIFVVYKNLTDFLPARSILRINDSELEYEVTSDVAAAWYAEDDRREMRFSDEYTLRLDFRVAKSEATRRWNLSCVGADFATYGYYWDPGACTTEIVNTTAVSCHCRRFGTFTVLTTKESSQAIVPVVILPNRIIVLVGCCTCLFLGTFSGLILLFHWIFNKSCVTFLKIQYCASTMGAMVIIITAHTNTLSNSSYLLVNVLLQVFLLTSLSSQLSILFVIYADLLKLKNNRKIRPTSICVITGAPIIIVFGSYLSHVSTSTRVNSWWLLHGTVSFNVFITCSCILMLLFFSIYYITMKFINTTAEVSISRDRITLLKSTIYVFISIATVIVSSILYINMIEEVACHCVLCVTSVVLGLTIFFFYIVRSELMLRQYFFKKMPFPGKNDKKSKKNSLTSNRSSTSKKISHDPNQAGHTIIPSRQTTDGTKKQQFENCPADAQQIKNNTPPDILNRENCASLDLVTSNSKPRHATIRCQRSKSIDNCSKRSKEVSDSLLRDAALEICCRSKVASNKASAEAVERHLIANDCQLHSNDKTEDICEAIQQSNRIPLSDEDKKNSTEEIGACNQDDSTQTGETTLSVMDEVMCGISNDLNYLLNRTSELNNINES